MIYSRSDLSISLTSILMSGIGGSIKVLHGPMIYDIFLMENVYLKRFYDLIFIIVFSETYIQLFIKCFIHFFVYVRYI